MPWPNPPDAEEEHWETFRYDARTIGWAMLLVFVLLCTISALLIANIPYDPDLYRTLYGWHRPDKGESTWMFLLMCPMFVGFLTAPNLLAPAWIVRRYAWSRDWFLSWAFVMACHTAGWSLAALVRDRAVWLYYFG